MLACIDRCTDRAIRVEFLYRRVVATKRLGDRLVTASYDFAFAYIHSQAAPVSTIH